MNGNVRELIKAKSLDIEAYIDEVNNALEEAKKYSTIFYQLIFEQILEQYSTRVKNAVLVEKRLQNDELECHSDVCCFMFYYCMYQDVLKEKDSSKECFKFCNSFFKEHDFENGTTNIEFTNCQKLNKAGIKYYATGDKNDTTNYYFPVNLEYLLNLLEEDGFYYEKFDSSNAILVKVNVVDLENIINNVLTKDKEEKKVYSKEFRQDYNGALEAFKNYD